MATFITQFQDGHFNSEREGNDRLNSEPMLVQVVPTPEFAQLVRQRTAVAAAGAGEEEVRAVMAGLLSVELVGFDGAPLLRYTKDAGGVPAMAPVPSPASEVQVEAWLAWLEDDDETAPPPAVSLRVDRRFPLSSSHGNQPFRLTVALGAGDDVVVAVSTPFRVAAKRPVSGTAPKAKRVAEREPLTTRREAHLAAVQAAVRNAMALAPAPVVGAGAGAGAGAGVVTSPPSARLPRRSGGRHKRGAPPPPSSATRRGRRGGRATASAVTEPQPPSTEAAGASTHRRVLPKRQCTPKSYAGLGLSDTDSDPEDAPSRGRATPSAATLTYAAGASVVTPPPSLVLPVSLGGNGGNVTSPLSPPSPLAAVAAHIVVAGVSHPHPLEMPSPLSATFDNATLPPLASLSPTAVAVEFPQAQDLEPWALLQWQDSTRK